GYKAGAGMRRPSVELRPPWNAGMRRHQRYATRLLQHFQRQHTKAPKGKLQLVIKSQKVSRFVEFDVPLMTPWGTVGVEKKRAIVYDYVLDETQRIALNEA